MSRIIVKINFHLLLLGLCSVVFHCLRFSSLDDVFSWKTLVWRLVLFFGRTRRKGIGFGLHTCYFLTLHISLMFGLVILFLKLIFVMACRVFLSAPVGALVLDVWYMSWSQLHRWGYYIVVEQMFCRFVLWLL